MLSPRPPQRIRYATETCFPAARLAMARSPRVCLLFSVLVSAWVWVGWACPAALADLEPGPKTTLDAAWQVVHHTYVDPHFNQVDWQALRHTLLGQSYTSPDAAYTALRQALRQLDDPYTRFMTPVEFRAFREQTRGELVGIGVQLLRRNDTDLEVIATLEGSPAEAAGLQAGDEILRVNGTHLADLSLDEAAGLIRGAAGTPVQLLIQRGEAAPFTLVVVRQEIRLPVVMARPNREDLGAVGYLRLEEFNAHAAEQVAAAVAELDPQVVAYVLDLRDNPGGRLDQAIAVAELWLDEGVIVSTRDRSGLETTATATGTALSTKPLAVLVNGNSASASEIVTGALQDHQRATVVGSQTFGKALVQAVTALDDGSGLNVTVARYYTPNGTDINHQGIAPDVAVEASDRPLWQNPHWLGTANDPHYVAALTVLAP